MNHVRAEVGEHLPESRTGDAIVEVAERSQSLVREVGLGERAGVPAGGAEELNGPGHEHLGPAERAAGVVVHVQHTTHEPRGLRESDEDLLWNRQIQGRAVKQSADR